MKPDKAQAGPNYRELPIQMSLSGDFNGFYSFLLQLEKLPSAHANHADELAED